ncbi:MAG: NUDIX domain-containing protein [Kofleriaceae bacterium]
MNPANTCCNHCGARFPDPTRYPRTCPSCTAMVWANPIPVAVALVPILDPAGHGLLVVRRGIPPEIGKLALVGGFIEEHESWQVGCAREVREETAVIVDPASCRLHWLASSEPKPNRILIFAVTAPVDALPAFVANPETLERGVIFGPGGLDEDFAFSTHREAARRYFADRGITGHHAFASR